MLLDSARRRTCAQKVREAWLRLSLWGPPATGEPPRVSMGRRPIRPAIRDLAEFRAEEPTLTKDDARKCLRERVDAWPEVEPRLAIEGDTGLGKTHLAEERCAAHVVGSEARSLLFVAPTRKRVTEVLTRIRERVVGLGGNPVAVQELLGRQPLDAEVGDSWARTRFGCMNPVEKDRAGRRGRRVKAEVCRRCPMAPECKQLGYLRHTEEAFAARVIVTTVQRLASIPNARWAGIGLVICDEDVLPSLLQDFWVVEQDLKRAARYILGRHAREELRAAASTKPVSHRLGELLGALPFVTSVLEGLKSYRGAEPQALAMLLPEECERYATEEGVKELRRAMPMRWDVGRDGRRVRHPDELAPAEWEQRRASYVPRQIWGPFLKAVISDILAGDAERAATVRVEPARLRKLPPRIHVVRFDERTIRHLRQRPLLLLDATLHPAISQILDVKPVVIRYRQGRKVVQVLTSLRDLRSLRERVDGAWRLTTRGRQVVAWTAAWCAGKRGFVFCRKGLWKLLAAEATRYYELRGVEFVTPGYERGWDAPPESDVFVVLGRHARNTLACLREAHALRSVYLRLTGTTQGLDALERPARALPFMGRDKVLLYRGEPVERATRTHRDRLAALLQDADRIATVRQFIGRDRKGCAYVLLLRGDPTLPVDALVEDIDLAEAVPVGLVGQSSAHMHHVALGEPVRKGAIS